MEQFPITRDGDGLLYALYGDPQELERGGYPYWLIAVLRNPYQAPRGLKCAQERTIAINNWIVNARWHSCTSTDPNHKAYTLLPVPSTLLPHAPNAPPPPCACGQESPHVHVRLSSFVTETGLEWARYQQGRTADRPSTGVFSDVSHPCRHAAQLQQCDLVLTSAHQTATGACDAIRAVKNQSVKMHDSTWLSCVTILVM